tara:strand:- start:85417 stop:86328 length:912 start_codon:yes stop_codon:yes gene_type:complete
MVPNLAKHTEKLYYFFEIANHGSLQACSRALGMSAPTLSYNLNLLEEILGSKLFNRGKGGVELTAAGERLWRFCGNYYRELDLVEASLSNPDLPELRRIRLGTFQSIAIYYLPLLLAELEKLPNISLSMMTDRSSVIHEALVQREVDIALTVETFKKAGMIRHELYQDTYGVYGSREMKKTTFTAEDLREHSLFYIPDASDKDKITLKQYMQKWGLVFRQEFELDSFEVVAEFVVQNLGIGVLPTQVAKRFKDQLKPLNIKNIPEKHFGVHRFFLSYRDDLDIPQRLMTLLLDSAEKATRQMK